MLDGLGGYSASSSLLAPIVTTVTADRCPCPDGRGQRGRGHMEGACKVSVNRALLFSAPILILGLYGTPYICAQCVDKLEDYSNSNSNSALEGTAIGVA